VPTRETEAKRRGRRRRSQRERREETQSAVLDATVECLAELGYAGTTTTRIARRARVSRGALLHYYSSKVELLTSAIDHILRRRTGEFRAAFAALPAGADRRVAAVDILWKMFSSSTFYAWLELVVAARSDRKLLREVSRITTQFFDTVLATYQELFPEIAAPNQRFDLVPAFTFAFLQGLALDRVAVENEQRVNDLLCMLKDLAAVILGPNPRPAGA
jgi:AcrR family transcriptional regulator